MKFQKLASRPHTHVGRLLGHVARRHNENYTNLRNGYILQAHYISAKMDAKWANFWFLY